MTQRLFEKKQKLLKIKQWMLKSAKNLKEINSLLWIAVFEIFFKNRREIMKLMIVDDASFMRVFIRRMIEKTDFEVVCEACDGKDAIAKFIQYKPDIITMDITMPNLTGIEALKEIKKISTMVKVIMVSAMGQEPLVREAVINGADSFIIKPFKEEKLIEVLEAMNK